MSRIEEEFTGNIILPTYKVKFIDGEYVQEISGQFSYVKKTFQDVYDKDGNFIKEIVLDSNYTSRQESMIRNNAHK